MAWWLATPSDGTARSAIPRFDPRYWTVNFPRPMMASITTPLSVPNEMRVDTVFYTKGDLCGLIWESADTIDHPLLRYQTVRDYRGTTLSFHWKSSGVVALDQLNGPTLTIEGRDSSGAPRAWYVRLWNYATGTATEADITLDFSTIVGGYNLPADQDPVFSGFIERMFISLVPVGYVEGSTEALTAGQEGYVEVTNIQVSGKNKTLAIGNSKVAPHGIQIATGYDDQYNITPARVLRNIQWLGYRGTIVHYVGMSHYFRLEPMSGGHYVSLTGGALNSPCTAWHADFATRCKALGYDLILSLSYEILDQHLYGDWKQIDNSGSRALTAWVPPSSILSPCHSGAMSYLQAVARAFTYIAGAADLPVKFQVGEPWWWVQFGTHKICLYDASTLATYAAEHGGATPPDIGDVRVTMTTEQNAFLDWAGTKLAASTASVVDAVKTDHPDCETFILIYLPTILDNASPEVRRANVPVGWAKPAFDRLQLEDYDWVTDDTGKTAAGVAAATERLGYPIAEQNYFSGFVLLAGDAGDWSLIDAAAENSRVRGTEGTYFWALPQVMRDGFVHSDRGLYADAFTNGGELWPLAPNWRSPFSITYEFRTDIFTSRSGKEQRRAGRTTARKSLKFLVSRAGDDARALKRMLNNFQGPAVQMADLSRFSRVTTGALSGQYQLTVDDTVNRAWLAPGNSVTLFHSNTYELAEIASVNATTRVVTFIDPLGRDWPQGTKLYPPIAGRLDDEISVNTHTGRVIEADITFKVDPGINQPDDVGSPVVTFNDREVFTYNPNFAQAIPGDYARKIDTVDFSRGRTATYLPVVTFGSRTKQLQMLLRTQSERRALVGLFLRQKGMRGEFYMPTFEDDFTSVLPAAVSTSSATFVGTFLYDTYQQDEVHRAIIISKADGSAIAYRRIIGATTDGTDTTLTTDQPWPFTIDASVVVNWLIVHRFAVDQLTVDCVTDEVSKVQLSVVSLEDLSVSGVDANL